MCTNPLRNPRAHEEQDTRFELPSSPGAARETTLASMRPPNANSMGTKTLELEGGWLPSITRAADTNNAEMVSDRRGAMVHGRRMRHLMSSAEWMKGSRPRGGGRGQDGKGETTTFNPRFPTVQATMAKVCTRVSASYTFRIELVPHD